MKIRQKLFLIQCGFSLVLVTILVLLMQWSIANGMVDYVNTKELEIHAPIAQSLASEYQRVGDWSNWVGQNEKFKSLVFRQLEQNPDVRRPPRGKPPRSTEEFRRPPPKEHRLRGEDRPPKPAPKQSIHYALLDKNETYLAGKYLDGVSYNKLAILVEGDLVGFFATSKRESITAGYELDFIEKQQNYLWLIGLLVMLVVVLVTFLLAHHLVVPIKKIAKGMSRLTQGDYKQQVHLPRKDELGELCRDFNELALTLAENESTRKRWLANISHELRTPVAILSLELEMMLDKIKPMTEENIASANDELKHLASLIEDLYQLTSADIGGMRYIKQVEDITLFIKNEKTKLKNYLADTGITLELDLLDQPIAIYCDKKRLTQLFENIMTNCAKYAQASLVKLSSSIVSSASKPMLQIIIEDNGRGVESAHLPNLFEHLYRTDEARNRKEGGTGLGLAICKQIVIAHNGEISAAQSELGGLAILITLPLTES